MNACISSWNDWKLCVFDFFWMYVCVCWMCMLAVRLLVRMREEKNMQLRTDRPAVCVCVH